MPCTPDKRCSNRHLACHLTQPGGFVHSSILCLFQMKKLYLCHPRQGSHEFNVGTTLHRIQLLMSSCSTFFSCMAISLSRFPMLLEPSGGRSPNSKRCSKYDHSKDDVFVKVVFCPLLHPSPMAQFGKVTHALIRLAVALSLNE